MMINLKRGEQDEEKLAAAPMDDNPYPWGTRISLDDEHLEALQLAAKVGDTVTIKAKADVVSFSQHEDMDDKDGHRSMSFQITDIEITPAREDSRSVVDTMYGSRGE